MMYCILVIVFLKWTFGVLYFFSTISPHEINLASIHSVIEFPLPEFQLEFAICGIRKNESKRKQRYANNLARELVRRILNLNKLSRIPQEIMCRLTVLLLSSTLRELAKSNTITGWEYISYFEQLSVTILKTPTLHRRKFFKLISVLFPTDNSIPVAAAQHHHWRRC